MLGAAGAEDPAATLRPLLNAALDNALAHGDAALTGPIVRGDVGTIRGHLAEIAATAPHTLPSYVAMARATLDRVVTDGRVLPIRATRIRQVLDDALARSCGRASTPRSPHASGSEDTSVSPVLASTRHELAALLAPHRARGERVGLVCTMGAMHEGHASLMRRTRAEIGPEAPMVVSLFVNPLQFGQNEDLERYPRTFEADLALCEAEGVDVLFAPSVDEVYPGGTPIVTVDAGPLATILEGASRPGHFVGVLTVVAKLFGLVRPDVTVFGEKDYQQLALVRRMSDDLCLGVQVLGGETVREADGLALSSRNRYLDPEQRLHAAALSRTLHAARSAAVDGARGRARGGPCRAAPLARRRPRLRRRPRGRPVRAACRPGRRTPWHRGPHPDRRPRRHHPPDRQHAARPRRGRRTLMLRTMMKSKIHRATVTQADLHYVGSVTVDEDLLDAADLLPGELVHIVDVTNGARLETYTIAGERGSGVLGINGAAARLVHPGDTVILIAYGQMDTAEARELQPRVVFVDADNKILATGDDPAETFGDPRLTRGDVVDRRGPLASPTCFLVDCRPVSWHPSRDGRRPATSWSSVPASPVSPRRCDSRTRSGESSWSPRTS